MEKIIRITKAVDGYFDIDESSTFNEIRGLAYDIDSHIKLVVPKSTVKSIVSKAKKRSVMQRTYDSSEIHHEVAGDTFAQVLAASIKYHIENHVDVTKSDSDNSDSNSSDSDTQ